MERGSAVRVSGLPPVPSGVFRSVAFALARFVFGAKFAKDGYDNLQSLDDLVEVGADAGVPVPELLVPAASGLLFVGGVLVALGLAPLLGVAAIAAFMLGVSPEMHDFWNRSGDDREAELDAFLRNAAFVGAAVAFWTASRSDE